jgi:hypothetical protein
MGKVKKSVSTAVGGENKKRNASLKVRTKRKIKTFTVEREEEDIVESAYMSVLEDDADALASATGGWKSVTRGLWKDMVTNNAVACMRAANEAKARGRKVLPTLACMYGKNRDTVGAACWKAVVDANKLIDILNARDDLSADEKAAMRWATFGTSC